MKNALIIGLIIVAIIAAGCKANVEGAPPAEVKKSCYVMKQVNSEEYDCFGCVAGNCKEPDLEFWEYLEQDAASEKGYTCESREVCRLKIN